MKKIVKNCLIGASLVVMLAFTLFLSINAKNNIKADAQFENKVGNGTLLENNKTYFIDANEGINYFLNGGSGSTISTAYSTTIDGSLSDLFAFRKMSVTSESGIQAYICDDNNQNCTLDYYSIEMGKQYFLLNQSAVSKVNILINGEKINTTTINPFTYIIDNKVYLGKESAIVINSNTNQPVLLGDLETDYFTLTKKDTSDIYIRTKDDYPYKISYLYNDIVLPPPSSNDFVSSVVDGLGSIFTDFVPSFVGAVVLTAQTAFITSNGTGTIVLGALVAACGIALTISILRFVLNLIKLKRKV